MERGTILSELTQSKAITEMGAETQVRAPHPLLSLQVVPWKMED